MLPEPPATSLNFTNFPQLTQEGISVHLQAANNAFNASATPVPPPPASKLTPPQSSNAPLNPATLKDLLAPIFGCDIQISTIYGIVTTTKCEVQYGVDKSAKSERKDRIFVNIMQCPTPLAAEAKMKDYRGPFQSGPSNVGLPADIGSYSLQTINSVFWVRNTIFAKVFHDDISYSYSSSMIISPLMSINQMRVPLTC